MTADPRRRPDLLRPVVETLDGGGQGAEIRLRGSSMLPSLRPGDTLRLALPDSRGVRFGSIVVWLTASEPRAHRLVGRVRRNGEVWLVTKGDALRRFDPPFPAERVAAVVAARVRDGEVRPLDRGWPRIAGILRGLYSLGTGAIGEIGERLGRGVRRPAG